MLNYKKVFNRWSTPTIIVNKEYELIDINEGACHLFRNHEIKLNLTKCYELFHGTKIPCGHEHHICPIAKTFERGEKFKAIHKHKTDIGEIVHEIITTPLFGEQGEVQFVIAEYHSCIQEFRGLISMCSSCNKIRMEHGNWRSVEEYIQSHSTGVEISHSYCEDCLSKLMR